MKVPLYMVLNFGPAETGPYVFQSGIDDGMVHSITLSALNHVWDFLGLMEHRYLDGLYLTSEKLAQLVTGYNKFTDPVTGYADTIWWNRELGVVSGSDSVYDALSERIMSFLFGKKDVMGAVLGHGRVAKAAVAALYPGCLYLNMVNHDSSDLYEIESMIDAIVSSSGKATCAVEATGYDSVALETMDIIVNANIGLSIHDICPCFTPTDDQLVIDLAMPLMFEPTLYGKVISRWVQPDLKQYRKMQDAIQGYYLSDAYGCHFHHKMLNSIHDETKKDCENA